MAATFDGFCKYARLSAPQLSDEAERRTAELCFRAAVDHARGTGISADSLDAEDNAKYELYVYSMAAHWFDARGFIPLEHTLAADAYIQREIAKMHIELKNRGFV